MDPVSMIIAMALKNPQATTTAVESYNAPGQVDASKLQASVADFAMQTLSCYHKTARFRGVDVLGAPWREQAKFGAEHSAVLRIDLEGLSGISYQMIVAAMVQGQRYRTFVIQETTTIPYNKRCPLEQWTTTAAMATE